MQNRMFREEAEKIGVFKSESFFNIIKNFYNKSFSKEVWKSPVKEAILTKYGQHAMSDEEKKITYNILSHTSFSRLFKYFSQSMGIGLKKKFIFLFFSFYYFLFYFNFLFIFNFIFSRIKTRCFGKIHQI